MRTPPLPRRLLGCFSLVVFSTLVLDFGSRNPAVFGQSETSARHSTYQVGVAKVDITPDYPVRLSGFAFRQTESEGVSQPIWARALAISQTDQPPVVIVTVDNLGLRLNQFDEVAAKVQGRCGLDPKNLAITFTHTHCAPKLNSAADNIFAMPIPAEQQERLDRYTSEFVAALESVVVAALENRQPATLDWGVGNVGFAKNRRTPGGPVDHSLPILVARSIETPDQVLAVYTSYACHCVTLSHNFISGDWAGYAVESIERQFPGAMGLVSIGCGSDQNPDSDVTGDKVDVARQQGMQIGDEIVRLVASQALVPLTSAPTANASRIELPFAPLPTRDQYQQMVEAGGPNGYNAQTQLARLDRGETIADALPYPIQTIAFGDQLCMVFLGGEVCVDYALRLRRELDGSRLWMHGYSNDFGAYIPSERLLQEGGYGAGAEIPYFALPTTLAAGLEEKIVAEVHKLVPDVFNSEPGTDGISSLTPQQSLNSMRTHPDLQIDLVACEPQIQDPVAIDFGLDGCLWVCQMNDYGHGIDEVFPHTGEVRKLQDLDQDGFFETATTFVDGLRYPTDVKVWRDGVLICDAPNIIFARDINNDGVADSQTTIFTGFATHNGQARVNSLQWGLDHWLYGSCGLFGGVITNQHGTKVDVTDRDFRLNPDTGEIQAVSGRTQQSRVRDDWGNWFGCDNGTLVRHYPLDDACLARNPFVIPPPSATYTPSGPKAGHLYPAGDLVLFKLSGAPGVATAACGLGIYRDQLLGPQYAGNSFTCEPVNQLVYRQVLTRDQATFVGKRADNEQDRDFLTSTDRWFRPVQARTGPDGGLWIVDMYRYVIEHPIWIPEETLQHLNVFAGQGKGRIYRVRHRDQPLTNAFDLSQLTTAQLVEKLNTSNGTVRDLVHQQVFWSQDSTAKKTLSQLLATSDQPAVRLQSLYALDGIASLSADQVAVALRDSHPEVRRHAIRLSEEFIHEDDGLVDRILELAHDQSFEVRQQAAMSLGNVINPQRQTSIGKTLYALASETTDAYLQAAVFSSLNERNVESFSKELLTPSQPAKAVSTAVLQPTIATAAGLGNTTAIHNLIQFIVAGGVGDKGLQLHNLALLLDGLQRANISSESAQTLDTTSPSGSGLLDSIRGLIASAREALQDDAADLRTRVFGLQVLGRRSSELRSKLFGDTVADDENLIAALLHPSQPPELQIAAVDALARIAGEYGARALVDALPTATPSIREKIVQTILQTSAWDATTVDAITAGELAFTIFDVAARNQLLARITADQQQQLRSSLEATSDSDRAKLIDSLASIELQTASTERGRQVFKEKCSACHRLEEIGFEVGPDIAALTSRTMSALLVAIIDPNQAVDARYQAYSIVTDDGRALTGQLKEETSTSITLLQQGGQATVVLRSEIVQMKTSGLSLMPEGLERELSRESIADLIAYLQAVTKP